MATRGQRRHLVTLENPTLVRDGEGFSRTWATLSPPVVYAEIKTATTRDLERTVANAVQSTASHIVTIDYMDGVSTRTRITKGPRNADDTLVAGSKEYQITGVQNVDERNITLVLAVTEVVP